MIKRFALLAVLFAPLFVFAQDVEKGSVIKSTVEKPSRDFLMLQFTYEGWSKPDSIHTKGIGRGFNGYLCYDFPIKKSHLSFAAGIGISTASVYLNSQEILDTGTGAAATFIPASKDYKKYKITTTYLEAPFELRYFADNKNRNRGFKAAIGLRVGTLLGAHEKDKISGSKIVEKTSTRDNFSPWTFAGTLRIGWGNFSVFGSYNLNTLFKEAKGPEITPYSFGIAFTGL